MKRIVEPENTLDNRIPPHSTILCDLDGTLVDTNYANFLSYNRAIEEMKGYKIDIQFSPTERFSRERLSEYIPQLTDTEYEKIIHLKSRYYKDFLPETRLNSKLADTLRIFSQNSEVILATTCRRKRTVETLQHHQLLHHFTSLMCREELLKGGASNKYKTALTVLGLNPNAVFLFENETSSLKEAIHAGVPRKNIIHISFD